MSNSLSRMATRVAYVATQVPRVAWYVGHDYLMRQLAAQAHSGRRNSEPRTDSASAQPRRVVNAPVLDQWQIYADLAALLAQDLANIEAGLYPLPDDHDGTLLTSLRRSRLFFEDLPAIHRRRERNAYREVLTEATAGKRPEYYLQNFHYQSGGWLTKDSADRYDTQVEVLFKGSANAMRRQALPPLHEIVAGAISVDCGCSTSPVARAGFSTSSNRHGRGFPSSGSIYRRPTAAMPGATSAAGLASISSSATRSRSRRRTAASTR